MMGESVRIALIGMDTLTALGIRTLLKEENGVTTDYYYRFTDFEPFADKHDGFIVDGSSFLKFMDFFLPRKGRSLALMIDGRGEENRSGVELLDCLEDESELKERLMRFVRTLRGNDQQEELSSREMEVLRLIARGKLNKEIADELFISVNTVITHRKNISSKLGVKSASGLSLYAMMNGLI